MYQECFLCLEPIKVQKYEDGSIYSNEIVASIEKLTLRYQEQKFRNERFKPTLLRYRQQKKSHPAQIHKMVISAGVMLRIFFLRRFLKSRINSSF